MISSANPSAIPAPEGFLARRARLRRIAGRFDCALPIRGYIIGKLATDPAYAAVLKHCAGTNLPIVDIGCGLGLLAHYLRDHGCAAPIHGYDFDAKKIDAAREAARRAGLNDVEFTIGDVADLPPPTAHLVLLDVLHYLEFDAQRALLEGLASRVREGGSVFIRVTIRDASWRYGLTVLQESWTRLSGWIPSRSSFNFPTLPDILTPFEAAGCRCEVAPLWGRTPFNGHRIAVHPPGRGVSTQAE